MANKDFGHGKKPSERPSKICPTCHKPFVWRKAWKNNWDKVIYCSDKCRANRK